MNNQKYTPIQESGISNKGHIKKIIIRIKKPEGF